ncbi:MAG: hypothetical protein IJC43_10185 [Clostridia bacterium]|nr:hypothetical protein [Clostridia bacterium]
MSIIVDQIALPPDLPEQAAVSAALRRLGLRDGQARAAVCRRSVDARRGKVRFVYAVSVEIKGEEQRLLRRLTDQKNIRLQPPPPPLVISRGEGTLRHRPVVVGFGPAGMFAALLLAREGLRPIVLERGAPIEQRVEDVEQFWRTGTLRPESNVQFGEGGAGSFSDGKLTTRIGDPRCRLVLETLSAHGAPERILIDAKPHVGTDLLRGIVRNIREEILSLGGEVRFHTRLTGLMLTEGRLTGLETDQGPLPCEVAVLAMGHSARDTATRLFESGVAMEKKPFSVGARIEHPQTLADRMFYGAMAGHPALPPAEYQLSHRVGERACYTFCMCPGGVVVPAASEEGGVVTNGMSDSARAAVNANAAVVASVLPEDIEGGPLEAIRFQRQLEQAAYAAGGGAYRAPAQSAASFVAGTAPRETSTVGSYARGLTLFPLEKLLPAPVTTLLREGLTRFDHSHPGFAGEAALLTGLETRTSSPLRLPRGEDLMSRSTPGLYPTGEGAGYAGGIVSAAVDGLRVAEAILSRWSRVCP